VGGAGRYRNDAARKPGTVQIVVVPRSDASECIFGFLQYPGRIRCCERLGSEFLLANLPASCTPEATTRKVFGPGLIVLRFIRADRSQYRCASTRLAGAAALDNRKQGRKKLRPLPSLSSLAGWGFAITSVECMEGVALCEAS
jgi:hypothetical protein